MKKAKRLKKRIHEIETKDLYRGERSPYWDFVKEHQKSDADGNILESPFANPDVLSEDDHMYHRPLSEEGELQFQIIRDTLAELSPQQQRVLQLCGFDGCTLKEAAKELNISIATVQTLLARAKEKIIRNYRRSKTIDDSKE